MNGARHNLLRSIKKNFIQKKYKTTLTILTIFSLISGIYYNSKNVQGTDFTFTQTSWIGGQSVSSATHTDNQTGWDKFSSQTNINTSVAGDMSLTGGITSNNSVTETFANANAKDNANTTANWDTVNQQIKGIPGVDAEDLYAKLNGTMGAMIQESVKVGDDIYIGGYNGRFAKYNSITGVTTDLSDLVIPFFGASTIIWSFAVDVKNGTIYIGGERGQFAKYDISTNTATDLTNTISSFWGANAINAVAFDDGAIYIGGRESRFAKYDISTNTATDLTSKISAYIGINDVNAFAMDGVNNILYVGADAKRMVSYDFEADFSIDLTNTIGSFWGSSMSIREMILDSEGGDVYLAGMSGRFAKYSISSNTVTDLYGTISSFWDSNDAVNALSLDQKNGVIYLGGGRSFFAKYTISANASIDLTNSTSLSWRGNNINAVIFDSVNNTVYFAGHSGKFGKYDISTKTYVDLTNIVTSATGNALWQSLAIDPANGIVYIAGWSGKFAKYTISTNTATNLTSTISSFWSTNAVRSMSLNNGVIYLGGAGGKFAKYTISTNTATNLTGTISSFWSTKNINAVLVDSANGIVYLAGDDIKFARYNIGSGITTDLSSKVSVSWGAFDELYSLVLDSATGTVYIGCVGNGKFGKYVFASDAFSSIRNGSNDSLWGSLAYSMIIDSVNGVIYIGGYGKFAKYTIATNTFTALNSTINSFWGSTNAVYGLAINPSNGKVYLGGGAGEFAIGHVSNSRAQSTTLDTVSDLITSATLTKNDTPGAESITYLLSNDGGANFFQVTPGVAHTFTTTGSNLKFRTLLSGYATIEDISISYTSVGNAKNGELISSVYNTTVSGASLSNMRWTESIGVNTDIVFQLRTSPNGTTWSSWCGPDDGVEGSCNAATYFTQPTGMELIDDTQRDKFNDQYFQYKAVLISTDGQNTPTLSDVTASYATSTVASVVTQPASNIAIKSATLNANITDTGGENPTRQIEYGTTNNGPYPNSCTTGVGGTGTYSCNISNLTPNTTYYFRAKAANSAGTVYGDQMSFITQELQDIIIPYPDQTKVSEAVSDGYMTLNSGQVNNTDRVQTAVNVTFRTDSADAVFPANTEVTKSDNTAFNFAQFITTNVTSTVRQENRASIVAVKIGVPNMRLSFSQPITIKLNVGQTYNGSSMSIQYQEDGETTWNDHGTCVVTNGQCIFTTTHATTYTVNGSGSISGATQNDITTDVQDVLSMDCDQTGNTNDNIVEFGNLTPGTPVTGSTTCTVTTNSDAGYTLAVRRNDAISTMDKDTDSATDITDRTNWNNLSPNTTTWQTNDTGLAFTVYSSTATKNTSWWGTGTTQTDANNLYAGFPTTFIDIMQHTTYNETATTTNIGYKLDVPTTQKSGTYAGDITYQVVTAP